MEGAKFEWTYRVKSVSHPTEPTKILSRIQKLMAIFGIINRRKGQKMRGGKIDRAYFKGKALSLVTEATPFTFIICNKTYVTSNELIIFSMIGKYVEYLVFSEEYKIE